MSAKCKKCGYSDKKQKQDVWERTKELRAERRKWMKATFAPAKIKSLFHLAPEELDLIKASEKYGRKRYYPEEVFKYIKNRKVKSQEKLKL